MPGGIRVIRGHRFSKLCGVRTKILFVKRSRSVDNESHHTRRAVLNRVSDEANPALIFPSTMYFFGPPGACRPWLVRIRNIYALNGTCGQSEIMACSLFL